MKICCNDRTADARYCQGCLEKALLGRTKQIDDWLKKEVRAANKEHGEKVGNEYCHISFAHKLTRKMLKQLQEIEK